MLMVVCKRRSNMRFLAGSACDTECAYRSASSATLPTAQADDGSDAYRRQPHQATVARWSAMNSWSQPWRPRVERDRASDGLALVAIVASLTASGRRIGHSRALAVAAATAVAKGRS
ncbi:hypothetical protein B296_00025465 [Ensete ventricosum]|uniref:Uncharacterized protein n=1 Tax=Ensete ventricosum TaxID=4639 RepID=A0A427AAA7_ENSVE|nr:hypothetical protein B296_00025465 [Ensete ventricosum]